MSNKTKLIPHYKVTNLASMTSSYLPEETISVLQTSAAFERDYIIDKTPYVKSGRANWIPVTAQPTQEDLLRRKQVLESTQKELQKTEPRAEVKSIASLSESDNKNRQPKTKDKE
jgi:hypothetical protein